MVRGGRCGSPGIRPFAADYRALARPGKPAERMLGISVVQASAGLCNRMRRERRKAAPSRPKPTIIRVQVCGSGTAARKPLISPAGKVVVWTLKYAVPLWRPASKAVCAPVVVPPPKLFRKVAV